MTRTSSRIGFREGRGTTIRLKKTLEGLIFAGSLALSSCIVDVPRPDVSLEKITQFTVEYTDKHNFDAPHVTLKYPDSVIFHWIDQQIVLYAYKSRKGSWDALMLGYEKSREKQLEDYKNWVLDLFGKYEKKFVPDVKNKGDLDG